MLKDGLIKVGHNMDLSPFLSTTSKNPVDHAATITGGTLQLGNHFCGHSPHVLAKNLTKRCA
jgi:hypothetical protein